MYYTTVRGGYVAANNIRATRYGLARHGFSPIILALFANFEGESTNSTFSNILHEVKPYYFANIYHSPSNTQKSKPTPPAPGRHSFAPQSKHNLPPWPPVRGGGGGQLSVYLKVRMCLTLLPSMQQIVLRLYAAALCRAVCPFSWSTISAPSQVIN